jgi:hypothetical protein
MDERRASVWLGSLATMRAAASLAVVTVALGASACGGANEAATSRGEAERATRTALRNSPPIETLTCHRRSGRQWRCDATDARHGRYSCAVAGQEASCITGTNVREP